MGKPVTPLESLGGRVRGALDGYSPERVLAVERARRGYLTAAFGGSSSRPRFRVFALVAVLASALLGLSVTSYVRGRPIEFTVGDRPGVLETWVAAPSGRAVPLRFSDGTVMLLKSDSRARVVAIDKRGASVALESGALRADVVHSGQSAWRVVAGPLRVRVTGTRFDLGWDASKKEFSLSVSEGSVVISGSVVGAERPVRAGETLRVFVSERRLELTNNPVSAVNAPGFGSDHGVQAGDPAAASPVSPERVSDPKTTGSGARSSATTAARSPDWSELARKGSLREAFALAEASGFDAACQGASAAELLQLGDGARLSGNAGRANQALTRLRSAFPGDPRQAAAAFALGKVAFDLTRSYAAAADWFATSIREQPSGSLSREAKGRLIEARQRSGDGTGARRAAESYLAQYPEGPHADLARSLVK